MADVTWRGDNPGFQTQAVGNYPDASDVADKDNIFLTDEGWVYRHFKNTAKTKFWDEIIWAGDVTNPPVANDPIDDIDEPTANVTFLVGDGYQYVEGPYPEPGSLPSTDTTITNVNVSGPNTPTVGDTSTYTVAVTGDATPFTYTWGVPVGEAVASGQGTTSITVTWANAGNGGVTCLVGSSNADFDGNDVSDTESVNVAAAPAPPATGPVTGITMTGTTSSQTDGSYTGQNTVSDNGSGLTVDYDVNSYVVSNVSVNDGGSGYEDGDEFTIVGTGGTAKGTVSI